MTRISSLLAGALLAFDGANAHPGHNLREEALERKEFIERKPVGVRSCQANLQRRGDVAASVQRRQQLARHAKAKRSLPASKSLYRRDYDTYDFSHNSSVKAYGLDENALFVDNSSCILQDEVTQGPYYVDGELIRGDIRESQGGVPLFLDIQLIDTSTCEPVTAVYVDFWHANATGVYSGVVANGNGDDTDQTNINNTFLRGIQASDSNGVVQIETIVPGHYAGRAPHIHLLTHNVNSTIVRTNGTLLEAGSNFTTHASHVGQLFLDQDLLSLVSTTYPYNTNTQSLTLNSEDSILIQESADTDPFIQYAQLTEDITDGLVGWMSIGIDPTSDQTITSAATHRANGGEANSDSLGMGPSDNSTGGGNGTAPTGTPPTKL